MPTMDPMWDFIPQLVWHTDAQGKVTYANASWREYTGLAEDRMEAWKDLMHPEDSGRAHMSWMKSIEEKTPISVECRIRRGSDGSYSWHKVFTQYVEKISACIAMAMSIEQEMQRDELYSQILLGVADPIVTFDAQSGIITSCNRATERTFLFAASTLQAQSINILLPDSFLIDENGAQVVSGIISEYAKVAVPGRLTLMGGSKSRVVMRRDGKVLPVTLSFGSYNKCGKTIYIAMFQVVAELDAHKELRQSKDNFLSTVSHELRTPLFGLLGTISAMQAAQDFELSYRGHDPLRNSDSSSYRGEEEEEDIENSPIPLSDPPSSRNSRDHTSELNAFTNDIANLNELLLHDFGLHVGNRELLPTDTDHRPYSTTLHTELRQMEECARTLLSIVNNMIDYYKLEHLAQSPLAVPFQPIALLGEECANFTSYVVDGVEFVYKVQENVPDTLVADSTLLRHVISNLVSNALRFTSKGKVEVTMSMRESTKKSPVLVLVVSDSGSGIPADYFPRMYHAFSPLEPNKKYGGVGLGLAVCKRAVELMEGEIAFTSTMGVGTKFEISLPVTINPPNRISRSLSLRELFPRVDPSETSTRLPPSPEKKLVRSQSEKTSSSSSSSLEIPATPPASSVKVPSTPSSSSVKSPFEIIPSPHSPRFLHSSVSGIPFPRPSQDLCIIPERDTPSTPPLSPLKRSPPSPAPSPRHSLSSSASAPPTPHKVEWSPPSLSHSYLRRPSFPFTVDDPTVSMMLLPSSPYISIPKSLPMAHSQTVTPPSSFSSSSPPSSSASSSPPSDISSPPSSPPSLPPHLLAQNQPSHYPPSLHIRVLVVEDNIVNQNVIKKMLKRMECIIAIATNGKEALGILFDPNDPSYIGYHNFDLILMDCQMPVMDGFQATRHIRQWEILNNKPPIKIAALTANGSSENERQCYAAGMDGLISKPVTIHGLQHVLLPGQPLLTSSSV